MRARSKAFIDKAISAMLAAIEVYNKPTFLYREDTFSILAIDYLISRPLWRAVQQDHKLGRGVNTRGKRLKLMQSYEIRARK